MSDPAAGALTSGDVVDAMTDVLLAAGVDPESVAEGVRLGHLPLMVVEHMVLPDEADHDLETVVDATGLSAELVTRVWRSLGFVEPRPGDHIFTDVDIDLLSTIGGLVQMGAIDDELVLQMSRVLGSSLARIAAALVDAIEISDEGSGDDRAEGLLAPALPVDSTEVDATEVDATDAETTEVDWADGGSSDIEEIDVDADDPDEVALLTPVLFPTLLRVMELVWRRHVQAVARARLAREQSGTDPDHMVVGFADLVGFTALSQQIGPHELAEVVERFETIAYDTVTTLGGRVVKMIGDEVMFAVPHERAAAEIALRLSETYRNDDELSDVRVGLASGPVLQREADLYGPVVNTASRLVGIAFPGTVVCGVNVQAALEGDVDYAWKSIGTRNLKDIGKAQLYVLRRSEDEVKPKSSRQRAEARRAERREARLREMDEEPRPARRRGRSGNRPGQETSRADRHDGPSGAGPEI